MAERQSIGTGESQVLALVRRIYDAGTNPQHWPETLAALREGFAATAACLYTHDHVGDAGQLEYTAAADPARDLAYARQYANQNVWVHGQQGVRVPGTIVAGRQIVPYEKLVKTEFYQDYLRPLDIYHNLLGAVCGHGPHVTYIGLGRPKKRRPFGKTEMALYHTLMPHFQRSLRIQQLIGEVELLKFAALDTIEALPFGACVLDVQARVLTANQAAEEIFAAKDGLVVEGDGLNVMHNGARARFKDLIAAAADPAPGTGNDAGGDLLVPRARSRWPLQLLVVPFTMTRKLLGADRPVALLFLFDREHYGRIDEQRLRRLYRLTVAEARLAALLAHGQRLDEAATDLAITYETARTHLKRIFSKTGAERQPELVRLILSGLATVRA